MEIVIGHVTEEVNGKIDVKAEGEEVVVGIGGDKETRLTY